MPKEAGYSISAEKTCYTCGKEMWLPCPTEYVYKREYHARDNHEMRYFCSYTCIRAYDKFQEFCKPTKRKKASSPQNEPENAISRYKDMPNYDLREYAYQRGVKIREITEYLNLDKSTVSYWLKKPLADDDKRRTRFKQAVDEIVKARFKPKYL